MFYSVCLLMYPIIRQMLTDAKAWNIFDPMLQDRQGHRLCGMDCVVRHEELKSTNRSQRILNCTVYVWHINRTLNLLSATTFSDKYICYRIHSFNLYSRNVLYQNRVPKLLLRFWLSVWLKQILWNILGPMLRDRQCRPLCGINCVVHHEELKSTNGGGQILHDAV